MLLLLCFVQRDIVLFFLRLGVKSIEREEDITEAKKNCEKKGEKKKRKLYKIGRAHSRNYNVVFLAADFFVLVFTLEIHAEDEVLGVCMCKDIRVDHLETSVHQRTNKLGCKTGRKYQGVRDEGTDEKRGHKKKINRSGLD